MLNVIATGFNYYKTIKIVNKKLPDLKRYWDILFLRTQIDMCPGDDFSHLDAQN
jgi:hypothetical protein